MSDNKSYEYRDIPEHQHSASVYVHCMNCKTFGVDMPIPFMLASQCGNCGSMETNKYYPSCCIVADRQNQAYTDALKMLEEMAGALHTIAMHSSDAGSKYTAREMLVKFKGE